MALSAEIIGDRWTLLILREAFYGVVRFDDMLADLGAPRSTLTDRLGALVDRGLMAREPYQEPGSRTRSAYVLTPEGRALGLVLMALSRWGEAHVLRGPAPVEFIDKETGSPLKVALVDKEGREVDLAHARIKIRP